MNDYPADCVVDSALIECKVRAVELDARGQRTFRVDLDWWSTLKDRAQKAGMDGAALVMNPKGSQKPLTLIDLDFFLELLALKKRIEEQETPEGTYARVLRELSEVSTETLIDAAQGKLPTPPLIPQELLDNLGRDLVEKARTRLPVLTEIPDSSPQQGIFSDEG